MSAIRPTRLVLVTHYYPSRRGGVEIVAGELATRLARTGSLECEWFASALDSPPQATPWLRIRPVHANDTIARRWSLPYPLWSLRGLLRLVAAIRRTDVVHLHDFVYQGSLIALLAARAFRKPVLITQHIGEIPYDSRLLRGTLALMNRTMGRWMLKRADQVLFVSATVMNYFTGIVPFRHAPRLQPNGVDLDIFKPTSDASRMQHRVALGLDCDRPVLLFVGRFVEKKGLKLLRKLAARIDDVQWVFAGHGPMDPRAWDLPNVKVLQGLCGSSLAAVYRSADLLVLPSRGEGFPLVVQEALACGTPVLVGQDTALGCPQGHDVLHALPLGTSNDGAHWEQQIRHLLASAATFTAERQRAADFAQAHWSWEHCAADYRSVIDTLRHAR